MGIQEADPIQRMSKFNNVCYDHVEAAVKAGHQVMVFVHSREETRTTADALLDIARERQHQALFSARSNDSARLSQFEPLVRKSRNQHIRRLFECGIGIHHAGLMRVDRLLTERMFLEG